MPRCHGGQGAATPKDGLMPRCHGGQGVATQVLTAEGKGQGI
jgi:hypothetical protein